MSELFEQITTYALENPGVVACACVTILLIGITQIILKPSSGSKSGVLSSEYVPYKLIEKRDISHNTRIFRFALPSPTDTLGLPLGQHISLRAMVDAAEVRRPYTPISTNSTEGYFDLLIKIYPAPNGKMGRYLDSLVAGKDSIDVRGPLGRFSYKGSNTYNKLLMVCGGTGITPMWQIIIHLLMEDPTEKTKINLVFANVNEDDILLRDELDELAEKYSNRFSVYYVLNNKPNNEWKGGVGFVTKDILMEQFGAPQDDNLALMCGPPPMNKAMRGILEDMDYKEEQIFKF